MLSSWQERAKKIWGDRNTKKFINHNEQIWGRKNTKNKNIILLERCEITANILAWSYAANYLAERYDANIFAYYKRTTLKEYMKDIMYGRQLNKLYKSFGVNKFVHLDISQKERKDLREVYKTVLECLESKQAVLDLMFHGINVGQDIYSTYLRQGKSTLDLSDPKFRDIVYEALEAVIFWEKFFSQYDVKSLIVSHACYLRCGVVSKIANKCNTPVYILSPMSGIRFRNSFYQGRYFKDYKEIFSKLPDEEQNRGRKLAQSRLKQRFAGEVGVDMSYSKVSSFTPPKKERVLRKSSKIKVLICSHCFFDDPYGYGKLLFTDFYEWLDFLGRMSNQTDYDWYLKVHPDYYYWPGSLEYTQDLLKKYPRIQMLPPETSHLQLAAEGLDFVLTVYGTVGSEYPLLGVQVINACTNNPHIAYDFNWHPKTIEEYENMLLHLDKLHLNISEDEVYQFYYVHHFCQVNMDIHNESMMFYGNEDHIKELISANKYYTSDLYRYFMGIFTSERHKKIMKNIEKFIDFLDEEYREGYPAIIRNSSLRENVH